MNEYTTLGVLGFLLLAAGAITLSAVVGGLVAGAITCMCWGALFLFVSTLR